MKCVIAMDREIKIISGTAVPLPGNNIDTDRIMPARFMKEITFGNTGSHVFYDERYDDDGEEKKHPFNEKRFEGASIMIVNRNFGCGSSREHAAQGLMRHGITAIIGESFSHIFAGNCFRLGIPCISLSHEHIKALMLVVEEKPTTVIEISLEERKIMYMNNDVGFSMVEEQRKAFVGGYWNVTELMRSNMEIVQEKAKRIPYMNGFTQH